MKSKNLLIFFIIVLFFILTLNINNVYASVDIPDVVMEKAKELNYGYDNFVILQDKTTKDFYIPYEETLYSESSYENSSWRYTSYYEGYTGLLSPSWWIFSLTIYSNGSFKKVSLPTKNKALIPLSTTDLELEIVYSSKDIIYYKFDGVEDGTIFFQVPVVEKLEGTIAPLLETEKMREVTKEIIAILPMILSVLVSLIALRKAWKTLSTFLKTS